MGKNVKFGVDLDKVDVGRMAAEVKKLGVEVAAGADVPTVVGALVTWYRKNVDKEKLAKCDCGGIFPAEYLECPYCGDVDGGSAAPPSPKEALKAAAAAAKPEPAKVPAKEEPPKAEAHKPEAAKPKPAKEPKVFEARAEVVKAEPDPLAGLGGKDLDNAVAELIRLKGNSANSMWELGAKLREVHERQLWKLRTDDKGKGVYRSFESFCSVEIKMSGSTCYDLIKIAENYTPEKVRALGTHKLTLLLKAPEEDRQALEAEAANASSRSLKKKVAKLREQKGAPAGKPAKVARGAAPPKGKGRKAEHITIVSVIGKKTLPCFKKPASKGEEPQPVECPKSVQEWLARSMPYAMDDLTNGVREVIVLTHDVKGRLQVRLDRKRLEE